MKWVGTTEAAALLRQFGIRARIVDFKGHKLTRMPAHLMLNPVLVLSMAVLGGRCHKVLEMSDKLQS